MGSTLLRIPRVGGIVLAYVPDSLVPTGWQSAEPVPGAAAVLGLDLDQRVVFYLDQRRRLIALDLEARIARPYVEGVRLATLGPDGSAYAIDTAGRVIRVARRATIVFPARYDAPPEHLIGTLNGQVVAISQDSVATLRILSVEQSSDPVPLPGGLVTATYWGELVAAADGRRVTLLRPTDVDRARRLELSGQVVSLGFSPSGHRLYALTDDREVVTIDRFSGQRLSAIALPRAAARLRVDPTGRWLLVRPEEADSAWVLDLTTSRITGSVPTRWTGTLPLVAGTATLLAEQGPDVVAWSLATSPPTPTAQAKGGAGDEWVSVAWVPPERASIAAAAAESAMASQDAALAGAVPAPAGGLQVFLQVSSSRNPDWAENLAAQLVQDGFPALVWQPDMAEEGYRVVIGPYTTRDEAEEVGRRLNRPFFVVTGPPPDRR